MPILARVKHVSERPPLSAVEDQAREVWDFCEGWQPERLPVALAFIRVEDPEMLIELLKEMRAYLHERNEFEQRMADLVRSSAIH